jgi:hypothetical protein
LKLLVPLLLWSAVAISDPAGIVSVDSIGETVLLHNGLVRLALAREKEAWHEKYYAFHGEWKLLLTSGSDLRPDPSLFCDRRDRPCSFALVRVVYVSPESAAVVLSGKAEGHSFSRQITLKKGERYFSVVVRDSVTGVHEFTHLLSAYSFVGSMKRGGVQEKPDFIWTPQLRPDSNDVIGDHTFRSPGLMFQHQGSFVALIPDVELIQPWRSIQTAGDLQVPSRQAPFFSYGGINWRTRSHVFYTHSAEMTTLLNDSRFSYGYLLYLRADAPPQEGFRDIVRLDWERWGRKNLLRGRGPQAEPFQVYVRKAWKEYLPQVLLQTTYAGEKVALLRQGRLAWSNKLPRDADNDCWFNVWFNALRTAYGMALHARLTRDSSLEQTAEEVLTLALAAPRREGIAPSIFYVDSAGGHWVSDHGWGGIDGGRNYAMFHNAWTSYWLLAWADLLPERRAEILECVRTFGEFLVREQRPSGVFPSWYDPDDLHPVKTFCDENAETGGAALLLAELYRQTRDARYLASAERAADYLTREILPRQKWFDFETFFSCARKPVDFFDSFTQQYPQNTLSMQQTAEAFLALWRITGNTEYLARGTSVLDYLCLYQQVWSPPWLSRELFGGFGVQNTDGEWSDARQGYFAVTLMRYYEATGEREYFERSVASLRAMFSLFESPTSPRTAENYAHTALDRPGGVTGIHWGTGSSVTSIHILGERYGGAFVNVAGLWGCGIDGCTVQAMQVNGRDIHVALRDDLASHRSLRLTFGALDGGSYKVVVNGNELGTWTSPILEKGIDLSL